MSAKEFYYGGKKFKISTCRKTHLAVLKDMTVLNIGHLSPQDQVVVMAKDVSQKVPKPYKNESQKNFAHRIWAHPV